MLIVYMEVSNKRLLNNVTIICCRLVEGSLHTLVHSSRLGIL